MNSTATTEVLFRADGNSQVGLGHIIRSLALAEMLKDRFNTRFVCMDPSAYIKGQIQKSCGHLDVIQTENDFFSMIRDNQIVVLDGYHYSTGYMQQILDKHAKLVYIDDLHNQSYPAHIIINHNPGAKESDYMKSPDTKLLLGLDYALLRKPFREAAKLPRSNTSYNRLLICMGGADPLNLGQLTLDAAIAYGKFEQISIIAAPERQARPDYPAQVKVHTNLDAAEMAQLMRDSDLMIGPASSVTMEALAVNLPVICGYYAENQKEFYTYLTDNKIAFETGDFRSLSQADIVSCFHEAIAFFHHHTVPRLIDGNQSTRFISELELLLN